MQVKQEIDKKERKNRIKSGVRPGWTRAVIESCHTMTKSEREGETWNEKQLPNKKPSAEVARG
jgi:hypothetical protein